MRIPLSLLLLFAFSTPLSLIATSIKEKPLEGLVAEADHVIVGKVTHVTMRNWIGWKTTNPKARTGPGSRNEIRLHIAVETNGVLKTDQRKFPSTLEVPLWRMWHYSLGSAKASEGKTYIFLLKGEKMERVYEGYFQRDLSEKETIRHLIEKRTGGKNMAEKVAPPNPTKRRDP